MALGIASRPGVFGMGVNHYSIANPDNVNGGVNHFGAPS